MTISKAKLKVRRKIEEAEEEAEEGGELNLVPYLDIVVNVVMFLLATITVVLPFGNLNVALPSTSGAVTAGAAADQAPDKPKLNLSVNVSGTGFIIAGSGGVMYQDNVPGKLPTIPKAGNDYDYLRLAQFVGKIKEAYADESQVILGANADIPYEIIVRTMDTLREAPGKKCTQVCKDKKLTPRQCPGDQLVYSGDCLFPEVALSVGVE